MRAQVAAHRRGASPRRAVRAPCRSSPLLMSARPFPESASICTSRSPTRFASSNASSNSLSAVSRSPSANMAVSACVSSKPSVLRSLRQLVEQALGGREPASCDGEGAAALVVPAEREREPSCAERIVVGGVRGIGALAIVRSPRRAFHSTTQPRRSSRGRPPSAPASRPRRKRRRRRARPAVPRRRAHLRVSPSVGTRASHCGLCGPVTATRGCGARLASPSSTTPAGSVRAHERRHEERQGARPSPTTSRLPVPRPLRRGVAGGRRSSTPRPRSGASCARRRSPPRRSSRSRMSPARVTAAAR